MRFDEAVEFVLAHEGGYSEDPADTAGETRFGISQRAYPHLKLTEITREEAVNLFRHDYWDKCRCEELPNGLDFLVFDVAVSRGASVAVRMLQKTLQLPETGFMDPLTIRVANHHPNACAEFLAVRMHQCALVPQVLRFGIDWYRRLANAAQVVFQNA